MYINTFFIAFLIDFLHPMNYYGAFSITTSSMIFRSFFSTFSFLSFSSLETYEGFFYTLLI